jgi:hypothetical protein
MMEKVTFPLIQGGEFAVLATDFQNRVHLGIDLDGSPGVGGDFIQHEIGPDDPAGELSARPGGAVPAILRWMPFCVAMSSMAASKFCTAITGLPAVRV